MKLTVILTHMEIKRVEIHFDAVASTFKGEFVQGTVYETRQTSEGYLFVMILTWSRGSEVALIQLWSTCGYPLMFVGIPNDSALRTLFKSG